MPSPTNDRSSSNFRKPPVEYQFKKGESGNPNGRPKKKNSGAAGLHALPGGIGDRLSAMALDEATRPVTVREGDKVSQIPALQALFRTMFRAAADGDTKAGRQLLEVIARAESGRVGSAFEILEYAFQYKQLYLPIFERHEREGREPPDIYPHPDDVIVDENSGAVTIDGPMSKEQAGARHAVRERAIQSMPRYFEVEAALKKDPSNRSLRREFKVLKQHHEFLKKDAERMQRREALRLSRRALETKANESDTAWNQADE
jgi:uncharacterized protein DUF5681